MPLDPVAPAARSERADAALAAADVERAPDRPRQLRDDVGALEARSSRRAWGRSTTRGESRRASSRAYGRAQPLRRRLGE